MSSGTPRPARARRLAATAAAVVLAVLAAPVFLVAPAGAAQGTAAVPGDPATWSRVAARPDPTRPRTVTPNAYRAYTLERGPLLQQLDTGQVSVPDPDGALVRFRVEPSTVMEDALAAAHPELQAWTGTALDGSASISLEATPGGVHVSVRSAGSAWYVDPAYRTDDSLYLSYDRTALPERQRGLVEPALPQGVRSQAAGSPGGESIGEGPGATAQLRTYRLALLSDPSFAAYTAPGADNPTSDSKVLAAKVVLVDRLNQIYGADLGIRLVLVNGTDTKLNLWTAAEATGADGPCGKSACYPTGTLSAGCTLQVLDRNRWVVGQLIGARNYDVGHLALGTDGGGIAYLDAVGTPTKAGGCTGLTAPSGDAYAVDYLAHELGHQFGADHTFEGTTAGCAGNRAQDSAVEPGSGSTIMGYAGICGADDLQAHSDPVFSSVSRAQVDSFVRSDPFSVIEWQSVALSQFDGTDSFQLKVGSATTTTIARGTSYTADAIKSALVAALPGSSIQVRPFFDENAFDDRGFSVVFTVYNGTFAANVPELSVVPVSGTFTSSVNDIDAGNPAASSGGTVSTGGNHNPVVTAPADRTIPVRTPFSLTGTGTDADGNPLTYVWEQTDTSGSATGSALTTQPKTAGPLFRVFGTASSTFTNVPTTGGATRSFPDLAQVVAGNTNADTGTCPAGPRQVDCLSEWLPTSAYTGTALHFLLTARDSVATGGGVAADDVVLTLDKSMGPFRVTSQVTTPGTPYVGGSTQTVTWTTGTSALAANVRITLSTDGGVTFPYELAASTPNDGSADVQLPDLTTSAARLRVEAVGNYFYDVNDAPFAIQVAAPPPPPLSVDRSGVPSTWNTQLTDPASVSFSASGGTVTPTATATGLPAGLALSAGSGPWTISGTPTAPPGSYPVTVRVTSGAEQVAFGLTVVVAPEDSTLAYAGPTSVVGTDPYATTVPVTLTGQVTQAADGHLGPIAGAVLTFTDPVHGVLCSAQVTTAGTGPGTGSCTFSADLSAARTVGYQVVVGVGGQYRGSPTPATALTVSLPDPPPDPPPGPGPLTVDHTGVPSTWNTQLTDPASVPFSASGGSVAASAAATGLPTGLALSGGGSPWTIGGTPAAPPGSYPVTVTVTSGAEQVTFGLTVVVAAEDSTVTYTGPTSVVGADPNATSVPVTLSAQVTQAPDGHLGPIASASVTFTDSGSEVLCSAPVTTAGTGPGTGSCTFDADLSAARTVTYPVTVRVGGGYRGQSGSATAVTVSLPDPPEPPATPVPPDTTIVSGPSGWLAASQATFGLGSSAAGSTYTCRLDGAPVGCGGGAVTLTGLGAGSHRLTVAATAPDGTVDESPAIRDFAVPVDDTGLAATGKWRRKHSGAAYLGTFSQARREGVALRYRVDGARELALLVRTGKRYGAVRVYLDGQLLAKVPTAGPAGSRLVRVGHFGVPMTGTVRIVTTSRRTVRVDGLGVSAYPF